MTFSNAFKPTANPDLEVNKFHKKPLAKRQTAPATAEPVADACPAPALAQPISPASDELLYQVLTERVGALHIQQRLGLESDHYTLVYGRRHKWIHIENWDAFPWIIRTSLKLTLLYQRARRNALNIQLQQNRVPIAHLPEAFVGFKILHLSDLHVDMNEEFPAALIERVKDLDYDICVLTGDYRYRTYGPADSAINGMAQICQALKKPVYGILGNHDSIRMVPAMEQMGVQMLINESITLERDNASIHLVGVDDPHYFRLDNLERACRNINHDEVSLLLAHTPEYYRHAAHAGFDFMMCGHTHGGQICLPGGIPIILEAKCPRRFAIRAWQHRNLQGYTSVGAGSSILDVRLNCLPEVTIHELCPS